MFNRFVLTLSLGALMAACATSTVFAGAVDSRGYSDPRYINQTVSGNRYIQYNPVLFSPGKGVVEVHGDGSTQLEVAVYDMRGNLVIRYTDYDVKVWFFPNYTQGYTIRVTNLGYVSNSFSLNTN